MPDASVRPQRARIAVIGAGAVGSYYGARLAEAGHDVTFLMRRDLRAVRAGGLHIESPDGDLVLPAPRVVARSAEIGPVDWVICALKTTAIEAVPDLVGPCIGRETRVLVLMNGLGLEERFGDWFGRERVFGGLAFTCINRGEPGRVRHLDYGPVTIGHLLDDRTALEEARALWDGAKVEVSTAPSLLRARWEKLCWNIPFNGLCVAGGGITTDRVMGDPALRAAARATMEDVVAAGNADLEAAGATARIDGPALIERMLALTETMGPYRPSTMIDFVEGRPMEVEAMFAAPLRRARVLGLEVPSVALLAALVRALEGTRGR